MNRAFALILILSSGCFRLSGTMHSSKSVETKDLRTTERRVPLPDQMDLSLSASVAGHDLVMTVERTDFCQVIAVTRSAQVETDRRELPSSHWAVLVGGVAFAGTGGALVAIGSNKAGDLDGTALGTPDEERDRDQGRLMQLAGIGALSLGATLLVSELIDYLSTGEKRSTSDPRERTDGSRTVQCGKGPAPELPVVVRAGSKEVTGVTDQNGRLTQPITSGNLADAPYASPFATVSCEGCDSREVVLPPDIAAVLVKRHRSLAEARLWLERHKSHSASAEIGKLIKELEAEKNKKNAAVAAAASKEARSALEAGQLDDADAAVKRCLDMPNAPAECVALRAAVARKRAALAHKEARAALKNKKLVPASEIAKKCLELVPDDAKCQRVRNEARKLLSSKLPTTRKALVKHLHEFGFKPTGKVRDKDGTLFKYTGHHKNVLFIQEDRRGRLKSASVLANAKTMSANDLTVLVGMILTPLTPSWEPAERIEYVNSALEEFNRTKKAALRDVRGRHLELGGGMGMMSFFVGAADTPDLR